MMTMKDTATEKWAPVHFDSGYEVSTLGRVRRVNGHVLIARPNTSGYPAVNIARRTYRVHRLVLEAFVGPCPDGHQCCHSNGNRADNRLSNLRWDTFMANIADRTLHGTENVGERNGRAVLSDEEAAQVRAHRGWLSPAHLGEIFGIHRQHVWRIQTGQARS